MAAPYLISRSIFYRANSILLTSSLTAYPYRQKVIFDTVKSFLRAACQQILHKLSRKLSVFATDSEENPKASTELKSGFLK